MAKPTNLYILIFPDRGIIKIGKADEIHNRIQALRRWWGEVDYNASYSLSSSTEIVFQLEKNLHFLLSPHAIAFDEGEGRTELFSMDALDLALEYIELFCSSGAVSATTLKRGVIRPSLPVRAARKNGKHVKFRKMAESHVISVKKLAEKFGRINRLLIFLLGRQSRIAYQYDITDGYVYFRLRLSQDLLRRQLETLAPTFCFPRIEDFTSRDFGGNFLSGVGIGNVIQYKVRLLSDDKPNSWHPLLSYFSAQSEFLLKQLPPRSSAALEPIPLLDESEVVESIRRHIAGEEF